jgi:hypothetical protein
MIAETDSNIICLTYFSNIKNNGYCFSKKLYKNLNLKTLSQLFLYYDSHLKTKQKKS